MCYSSILASHATQYFSDERSFKQVFLILDANTLIQFNVECVKAILAQSLPTAPVRGPNWRLHLMTTKFLSVFAGKFHLDIKYKGLRYFRLPMRNLVLLIKIFKC